MSLFFELKPSYTSPCRQAMSVACVMTMSKVISQSRYVLSFFYSAITEKNAKAGKVQTALVWALERRLEKVSENLIVKE